MLLVIHNLPSNTRYADIKALVKEQCGLSELIVDNLVSEGKTKKVTIGLADESDGALLMRKINGLYIAGQQLFVENVKQKKAEPTFNQYDQEQCNQYVSPAVPQFDNSMYYQPQNEEPQFYSPTAPMDSSQPQLPSNNFGIPYYMTNQNPIVGNTQQYSEQVQYPQVQGPISSDPYSGQNYGMNRGHESREGFRNRSRSRSPNRVPQREREPRASTSRWNEPERKGSDSWPKGSDKTSVRDRDRYYDDQFYSDRSYQDTNQGRSERNYGSNKYNNDRLEKNYKRSDSNWESSNRNEVSSFSRHNESFDSNDRRKVDSQSRHYHQDRQPQDFTEDIQYPRSRNSDDFSRGDNNYRQKRPYDSPDKTEFAPKNKKFGNNQQYNSKTYPNTYGNQYSKNQSDSPQHNKTNFYNKMGNRGPVQPMQSKQNNFKPSFNKGPAPAYNPFNMPKDFSVRWEGWLCQASSIIAQQILKNVQSVYSNKKHPVIVKLKACVRSRIDVVTGNEMSMKLNDMLLKYREMFPESDDHLFYETVLQKVDQTEIEEFLADQAARLAAKEAAMLEKLKNEASPLVPVAKQSIPKPGKLGPNQKPNMSAKYMPAKNMPETQKYPKFPSALPAAKQPTPAKLGPKPKPAQPGPNQKFQSALPAAKQPTPAKFGPKPQPAQPGPIQKPNIQIPAKNMPETGSVPKLPNANVKKARKENITNDSLYTMDDLREKILKEELDKIFNMCNEEIQKTEDSTEKSVSKFISDVVLTDSRKVMSYFVKKRVMNICTNLVVRVYCHPKCPKKPALEAFLRDYGVTRIKKSDMKKKLYLATCGSFEHYDALCKLNSTRIESMNIQFRPLLSMKPPKEKNKNNKKKGNVNMDEKGDEEMGGEDDGGFLHDEEEKDDVIEVPDDATGDEESNGYNKHSECNNENSNDVTEVEDHHNNSADTVIIEDDKGEADVALDEVKPNKDVTIVDEKTTTNKDVTIVDEKGTTNKDVTIVDEKATSNKDVTLVDEKATTNNKNVTIVDEKATSNKDVTLVDEKATTNKDVTIVDEKPTVEISDDNQNIEPDTEAAIDFAADDLEDF